MTWDRALIDGRLRAARVSLAVDAGGLGHGVGVFETLPVVDGRPTFLEAHWRRLCSGAAVLDLEPPTLPALRRDVTRWAAQVAPDHRMRILLIAEGTRTRRVISGGPAWVRGTVGARVGVAEVPHSGPRALAPWKTTGGWLTSRVAAAGGRRRGWDEVLLESGDGILEGSRSNVFVRVGAEILTPPLTLPILPGIARRVLLEEAAALGLSVAERPVTRDDLARADEVGLSGSLLGLWSVAECAGRPLPPPTVFPGLAARFAEREREDRGKAWEAE